MENNVVTLNTKLTTIGVMTRALKWWNDLPIQNLQDMSDSWVGYVYKYYPDRAGIYDLTDDEILYIWKQKYIRYYKIQKIKDIMSQKEKDLNEMVTPKLSISIVMYRFYEMVLWLIFLCINIPYSILITIPYLLTGKDFITPLAKVHEKCLFKS